ncbi:glycosyltransferase family 4 protein [Xylanibacter ruminicola]|uniref:glycosyltransferase family 4 protein n=1 Tax=Xylanibacter ruminicola TaxID=839 RepID=UPI00048C626C|nr:glycosyltransferase family 4 protein [Xylanibacter ruminicola]
MLEVIYLISRARPSGPINQALNILTGMKQNGRVHAALVTLAPEEENNSWLQRFYDNGIEVVQFMQPLKSTWRCVKKLRQYVEEHHVDVIHSAGYRADTVSLLTKCGAIKVSTQRSHPHDVVEKFPKWQQPLLNYLHLKMLKKMDGVVACSKSLQSVFMNEFFMNIDAVQNGVNTEKFKPATSIEKEEARTSLGLTANQVMILILGSVRTRKNIQMIVDSLHEIKDERLSAFFVGGGPQLEEMREQTKNDDNIHFIGQVKDPSIYLKASDVMLSASLAEGLPNSILEALACGLSVVLSDIEPHKELIEGTGVGALFSRDSKEELIDALKKSMEWDKEEVSQQSRQLALDRFSIWKLAENYENVYKKILNRK